MLRKVLNIRTALVVMFGLLIMTSTALGVIYINDLYEQATNNSSSQLDVIDRKEFADGSTIKVPKVVVVGEPFIYETSGKKLVENGADVRLQVNCIVNGYDNPYTIGTFYSDLPKGNFDLRRSTTVPVSSKLQSSKKCKLTSVASYTFYRVDQHGNETSFTVSEVGYSNEFELVVKTSPATQPSN